MGLWYENNQPHKFLHTGYYRIFDDTHLCKECINKIANSRVFYFTEKAFNDILETRVEMKLSAKNTPQGDFANKVYTRINEFFPLPDDPDFPVDKEITLDNVTPQDFINHCGQYSLNKEQ